MAKQSKTDSGSQPQPNKSDMLIEKIEALTEAINAPIPAPAGLEAFRIVMKNGDTIRLKSESTGERCVCPIPGVIGESGELIAHEFRRSGVVLLTFIQQSTKRKVVTEIHGEFTVIYREVD